jgi:hypothetical protein
MYEHTGALKWTIDGRDFSSKFIENIEETAWRRKTLYAENWSRETKARQGQLQIVEIRN